MLRALSLPAASVGALLLAAGCFEVRGAPYAESGPDGVPSSRPSASPPPSFEPEVPPRREFERPVLPPVKCDVLPSADCVASFPRVMIVMDASSSMLAGRAPGQNNWDKARYALAGNPDAPNQGDPGFVQPAFERELLVRGNWITMEDVFHLGMIAFNAADTQRLMLQYAPCASDNIRWAMDPEVSCEAPGCLDPYVGEPVWTFKNSDVDRQPAFVYTTQSYMPLCNEGGPGACIGTMYNTYTAEGLEYAWDNIARYREDPEGFELAPQTRFANILITDGDTAPDSDPRDMLSKMAKQGVPTYVIGLQGTGFNLSLAETLRTLDSYAEAGGTELATLIESSDVNIAEAFATTVTRIIDEVGTDPCCQPNDCSIDPEPLPPRP